MLRGQDRAGSGFTLLSPGMHNNLSEGQPNTHVAVSAWTTLDVYGALRDVCADNGNEFLRGSNKLCFAGFLKDSNSH